MSSDTEKKETSDAISGEVTPLLHSLSSRDSVGSDVVSSTRSTDSTGTGDGYFGFSSHWLNTANQERKEKFRSEREHAVERGIVQAAFLIRDAVLGESENPSQGTYDPYLHPENSIRNFLSLVFRQILSNRSLRQVLYVAVWIMTLLTVVEPPRWCSDGYQGDETKTCQVLMNLYGPAATTTIQEGEVTTTSGNEAVVEYYPNARSVLLTKDQSLMIELICVSYVALIFCMRIGRDGCSLPRYLRRGPAQLNRILQILCVGLIYVGLWSGNMVLQPFIRLVLLGTFFRILHEEVSTTIEVVSARAPII